MFLPKSLSRVALLATIVVVSSSFVASALAQSPTGELAFGRSLRAQGGPRQPVLWKLSKGGIAEVAQLGGYAADQENPNLFGLELGSVYRFRLSGFERIPGAVIYPTVELLGRLDPPVGREWEFPVEINIPDADVLAALDGALVTRVVFLENSENPVDVDTSDDPERLTLDVPRGVDPVFAAATRGRVLAIVRLGSRGPSDLPAREDPFFYGLPQFEFKPIPGLTPDAAGAVVYGLSDEESEVEEDDAEDEEKIY